MPSVIHVMMSALAAAIGVVFNGYILFVFIWNRRIKTANRLLLFHLAFVDIVFSFTVLLYNTSLSAIFNVSFPTVTYELLSNSAYIDLEHQETSSRQLCQAQGFLWSLLPMVVVWNVCGLSCDRYAAISIPLHYSRLVNARRACYFVAMTWILGFLLASPPLAGMCPHAFWDARWGCAADCIFATPYYAPYAYIHTVVAIALPVMVIVFCNLHMLVISRYHRHGIAAAICDMTSNAQATITHQRSPCYLSKFKGKNAFFTIAQVVGSLAVFTLPYYGVFVWEAANSEQSSSALVSVATFLLTCTPSINAYVYGVKSRMLRQTVKRLLQRHLYGRNTNQDIKLRLSEIFSDQSRRPPLSRRLSAPAGYCHKMQAPNETGQVPPNLGQVINVTLPTKPKPPFVRSVSLPVAGLPITDLNVPPAPSESPKSHVNNVDTKPGHQRRPLQKCESAPEQDVLECEIHHLPPTGLSRNSRRIELRKKRENFVRSSSYPTQNPSYSTKRKMAYAKRVTRQQAIDFDEILEGQENETEGRQESTLEIAVVDEITNV